MITLVPFAREHFAALSGWFGSEADIIQWGGPLVHFPLTDVQLQTMLDESHSMPPKRLCWMAMAQSLPVGHAQLAFMWETGTARLSRVAIAPAQQGRGLAIPMLRQIIREAFRFPTITRLELNVYAGNAPAQKTYQKLGFQQVHTQRATIQVNGTYWDTVRMSMQRPTP
ncbi:putative acetyltransferase protein [Acetobacter tropicalis NBRC 101654]|uniref:Putative acetyltransferase protein n=1 Tax=Acetobacter tropicalis NBRC 101654 TaxID=749388 RepID=F7VEW1_9PROT|nr:GNAT family protein [Acetobacter tropicalis]GAA08906.1 putative acetyltransferase protein [Acetobacter tropicalis NBRC 101654]